MKRSLLTLLAALALPSAGNANTYDDMLMRTRWPEFIDNYNNGFKFQEVEDFEMTCSSFIKANYELENYFPLFQRRNLTLIFLKLEQVLNQLSKYATVTVSINETLTNCSAFLLADVY